MNPTLIIAGVSAIASGAAGFVLAWQLQAGNISELELTHANERMAIQRAAHLVKERQVDTLIQAQNDSTARAVVSRRELDSARSTHSGLRDELDIARRAAATSLDACTVAANTTSELLVVCADRYIELAGKAQGHVSDVRTLMQAWPK